MGVGGELDEDTLNDVVGHGGVAVETLEGCAVDEVAVACDEGGKRGIAAAIREGAGAGRRRRRLAFRCEAPLREGIRREICEWRRNSGEACQRNEREVV